MRLFDNGLSFDLNDCIFYWGMGRVGVPDLGSDFAPKDIFIKYCRGPVLRFIL